MCCAVVTVFLLIFYAVDMIRLSTVAVIFVMSLDDIYFYWSSVRNDVTILLHPVLVPTLTRLFSFSTRIMIIIIITTCRWCFMFIQQLSFCICFGFDWGGTHYDKSSSFHTVSWFYTIFSNTVYGVKSTYYDTFNNTSVPSPSIQTIKLDNIFCY